MLQVRSLAQVVCIALSAVCCTSIKVNADTFYIGPSGSNGNNGMSSVSPWGTFDFAIDQLDPGDTLLVLDGIYNLNSRITLSGSDGGTAGNRVNIWADTGATPILDFSGMSNSLWGATGGRGIQIDNGVDWLHFKGLTVQNARDNGIGSQSDNSIFEQLTTRWNGDSGLQLDGPSSNNLILNSDSYENYDPSGNGENADGFALKFSQLGPGNVVRGSRAWGNADDGWDMWQSTVGGVLVEDSWAWDNGKIIQRFFDVEELELDNMDADNFGGDGNGYKLGQDGGPHVLNRVLAWENAVRGIDLNGNGYGVTVNNSTVYKSVRNWDFDENAADALFDHVLRNNISFAGTESDRFFSSVDHAFNTWNGIPVDAGDFLSLDDTIARGPRQADGSLPVSNFLKLVSGSNLIDAGTDVGLPYNGLAPDLGAFEFVAASGLLGDYNNNDVIDAADYSAWRDAMTGGGSMTNDPTPGTVDESDFLYWRDHFGESLGSGAGAGAAAVPEPATLWLMLAGTGFIAACRRQGLLR